MEFYQIILLIFVFLALVYIGFLIGNWVANKKWEEKIPSIREDAINRSRAVLAGQFSEQLAPYLPDFPYKATECRFIGKPIDFLVFTGMDEKEITEVKFIEVKSGKSKLSTHERKLRDIIKGKKVTWEEYRIPEEITTKKP
ncbi:MAG: Holliday junction resolvase-like protein [Candidatus Woesearchaeota archaeon]